MHHTSNVYSIIGKNAKNHNNSIISCYNRVIYDVLTFCKYFRLGNIRQKNVFRTFLPKNRITVGQFLIHTEYRSS